VKRAYTERALKYHPDRQSEQSADARERAEFHMREINAAWEVLRSPARRAEYDTRLRGDTPVWEQRGARAKRTVPVSPRVADLQPQPSRSGAPPPSGFRMGPIVALVVIGVVAVVGFAAWSASSSSRENRDVNVQTGTSFAEGSCVVLASVSGRITPVADDCGSTGAMRIALVTDLGRPCPTNLESFDLQAEKQRLCLDDGGP
jgi:DnaJ-class molecular chaperone